MENYLLLLAGVACAALGGEWFVQGAVGLARWGRVSPGIVAVTISAFATSSPELSVAINSALAGQPEISFGDALGSNVVNVALILGAVLLIAPMRCARDSIRRDFPFAIAVPLLTVAIVADGLVGRLEAMLLLAAFIAWLTTATLDARRQRSCATGDAPLARPLRAVAASAGGLLFLTIAGTLIVAGARGVARAYGLEEFVIGATVVAIGTSVPELATALMAKLRGHDEVGLGTILGSNLFNGLFIVSVAASIHPIHVERRDALITLGFGVAAVALAYPRPDGIIPRVRGAFLCLVYAAYLFSVLQ